MHNSVAGKIISLDKTVIRATTGMEGCSKQRHKSCFKRKICQPQDILHFISGIKHVFSAHKKITCLEKSMQRNRETETYYTSEKKSHF